MWVEAAHAAEAAAQDRKVRRDRLIDSPEWFAATRCLPGSAMRKKSLFLALALADPIIMEPLVAYDKATRVYDTVLFLKYCEKRAYMGVFGYVTRC